MIDIDNIVEYERGSGQCGVTISLTLLMFTHIYLSHIPISILFLSPFLIFLYIYLTYPYTIYILFFSPIIKPTKVHTFVYESGCLSCFKILETILYDLATIYSNEATFQVHVLSVIFCRR